MSDLWFREKFITAALTQINRQLIDSFKGFFGVGAN